MVIDFWTYTCINWLAHAPADVRALAPKSTETRSSSASTHRSSGSNGTSTTSCRVVRQMRIAYPVVIPTTTTLFGARSTTNTGQPSTSSMLADGFASVSSARGNTRWSEAALQRLLAEAGVANVLEGNVVSVAGEGIEAAADWDNLKSPETYVGYDRMANFASRGGADPDRRRVYAAPARMPLNQWALAGEWTIGQQATVLSVPNGRMVHRFHARDVHLVMGLSRQESTVRFRVSLDGQPPGAAHGLDVDEAGNGTGPLEQRLYQLVRQPRPVID